MQWLLNHPWTLFLVSFVCFSSLCRIGFRIGARVVRDDEERREHIIGTRDALGVMLSLLLGFTLAMTVPRYEQRRQIVVEEANAIGTTYLRAKVLSEPSSSKIQALLRRYVDTRIEFFNAGFDTERAVAATAEAKKLHGELWAEAVTVAKSDRSPIAAIFLQTLNETIDIEAKRTAFLMNRLPRAIWFIIFAASVLLMLLIGASVRRQFLVSWMALPLIVSIIVGLTADLDSARGGLIRSSQFAMIRLQADLRADAEATTHTPDAR